MRRIERSDDTGFTLVELLVVIVILGILAAVVVFSVGGITDRGETSSQKADTETIANAEEAYLTVPNASGRYATEGDLVPKFLADPSTLHDICLTTNHKAYQIIAAGSPCPPGFPVS